MFRSSLHLDSEPRKLRQARVGTVVSDPILAVAQFAVSSGLAKGRVENVMGARFGSLTAGESLPGAVGPDLFRLILDEGGVDAPSLQLAERALFSFFGGLERTVLLAPNGREALRAMAANFSVFHDRMEARLEESSTYSYFSFRFLETECDNGCCNELVLGVLMRLMRAVFGRYAQPVEVRLQYDRNGSRSTYNKFFGGKLTTCSPDGRYGLVLRRADMSRQQPGYDADVFELSNARLALFAEERCRNSSLYDFFELINASNICAAHGQFSVSAVARQVGVSERKAQRIAQSQGTTVAKLVEHARLRMLCEAISRNEDATAEDLSELVGLSDGRALRRALKSWTGKTLRDFRLSPFGQRQLPLDQCR